MFALKHTVKLAANYIFSANLFTTSVFGWHVRKVMKSFNLTALFQEIFIFFKFYQQAFIFCAVVGRATHCALEVQQKWLIDYLSLGVELLSSGTGLAFGRGDFVV